MSTSPEKLFADIGTVARFEALRAIGSTRGLIVFALYLSASAVSGTFYVKIVRSFEEKAIELLQKNGAAPTPDEGASQPVDITKLPAYESLVKSFAGDDQAKAELWATTPPIVLVSFWLALFFLPWLMMLSAHDVLARDNEIKTLRFVRPRTSATAWVLGKFIAQTALVFLATAASGLVVYAVAVGQLETFEPTQGALAFARFWWRLLIFDMGFMGVIFVVSVITRTAFTALLLCGFTLFALALFQFIGGVEHISPFNYKDGLWLPLSWPLAKSLIAYVAFAIVGVVASIAILRNKEI